MFQKINSKYYIEPKLSKKFQTRKMFWVKFSLVLFIFLIFYIIILGFVIVSFGSSNFFYKSNFETKLQKVDVAIVLGAGLIDNLVSPVLEARIDHALDLWEQNVVQSVIFTGGIGQNKNISEGEASYNWAIKKLQNAQNNLKNNNSTKNPSFDKNNFFFETKSKTTKQNLQEANQIMKQNSWHTAVIVSDPLHLFRAQQIAKSLNMQTEISATPFSRYVSFDSRFGFLSRELWFCQVFWLTGS